MARGILSSLILFSLILALSLPAACQADQPAVSIVTRNTNEVLGDIELLFKLAGSPAQFGTLSGILDVFLVGTDRSQPVYGSGTIVKVKGNAELNLTTSFSVTNAADFKKLRDAWKDLDIKTAPVLGAKDVFSVKVNGVQSGYLRYDPVQKYAHVSEKQAAVMGNVILPDLTLLGDDDIAIIIDNSKQPPEDRKQIFTRIRKEALDSLKEKAGENPKDFALRKLASEQQVDEFERFFVDSSEIRLSLTTDAASKFTRIRIKMKPIPGTSLAQSIDLVGKNPALYVDSGIAGSIGGLFLNFPLDSMRQKHIQDFEKLARPRAKERIAASTKTEGQKKIDSEVADVLFDVLSGFGGLNSLNGFKQVLPNGQNYVILGGVVVADGGKVKEGLKNLGAHEAGKVTLGFLTIGDVEIHTIKAPEKAAKYPQLFGEDKLVFVGTSKNAVWYALGDGALAKLQIAIPQAQKAGAKTSNTLLKLDTRLLPIIQVLDARMKAAPPAPVPAAVPGKPAPRPKPQGELRALALQTFAGGKDILHFSIDRDGQTINVELKIEEGVLTFFGKAAAKFVRENLE